ncbi:MAG: tetratricopeptide repeat protein [Candidatus Eremiobacteraeota bacterium]|nr:tetratricopeptide repeat protein [Candidatus Eremiobacteraeota bacterium]
MAEKASYSLQKYSTLVKLNPDDPEAHFGLAMAFEEANDFNEAYKGYEQCIRLNTRHARARLHMGFLFARQDELARALDEWQKAFDIDPTVINWIKDPSFAIYYKKRIEESLSQFQRPIMISPDNAYAHYQLGLAYKFFDRPELSLQSLKKAVDINPKLWEAYVKAGDVYSALGQNKYSIMQYKSAINVNPKYADAYLNLGITYEKENMIALAVQQYERALELDADNYKIYYGLGRVYFKQGNNKLAIKAFQKSIDYDKSNPEVHFSLAKACEAIYRPDFAIMEYERAIECDPKYAEAYYQLGSLCLQMGDTKKAIDSLENALKINPADAYAHYQLGTAYFRVNNYERAINHFYHAAALNPKDAFAFYNLGLSYIQTGNYPKAIEELRKALELSPSEASYYQQLSLAYSRQNMMKEAIENLNKAIDLKPSEMATHLELALIYKKVDRFDDAIVELRKVLEIDPRSVDAHYELGMSFIDIKESDFAYEEFQKAISTQPDHAPSLHGLGVVFAHFRNQMKEALEYFTQAVKANPQYAPAFCDMGDALIAMNDNKEALVHYEKAFELSPDDLQMKMKYASALMKSGKVEKGTGLFAAVINENPDDAHARYMFAKAYEDVNEINRAIEQYQRASALSPEEVDYHLALAKLYQRLQKVDLAKQEYYNIIRIAPDHEEAQEALAELFGEKRVAPKPVKPMEAVSAEAPVAIHGEGHGADLREKIPADARVALPDGLMPGLNEGMFLPSFDDRDFISSPPDLSLELGLTAEAGSPSLKEEPPVRAAAPEAPPAPPPKAEPQPEPQAEPQAEKEPPPVQAKEEALPEPVTFVEPPKVKEEPLKPEPVVEPPEVKEEPLKPEPVVEPPKVKEEPLKPEPVVEPPEVKEEPLKPEPVVEPPEAKEEPLKPEPVVEPPEVKEEPSRPEPFVEPRKEAPVKSAEAPLPERPKAAEPVKEEIDPLLLSAEECLDIPILPDIEMLLKKEAEQEEAKARQAMEEAAKPEPFVEPPKAKEEPVKEKASALPEGIVLPEGFDDIDLEVLSGEQEKAAVKPEPAPVEQEPEAPKLPEAISPFEKGRKLFEEGSFDAAASQFSKIMKHEPQNYRAFYYLGLIEKEKSGAPSAQELFSKAFDLATAQGDDEYVLLALAEKDALREEAAPPSELESPKVPGEEEKAPEAAADKTEPAEPDEVLPFFADDDILELIAEVPSADDEAEKQPPSSRHEGPSGPSEAPLPPVFSEEYSFEKEVASFFDEELLKGISTHEEEPGKESVKSEPAVPRESEEVFSYEKEQAVKQEFQAGLEALVKKNYPKAREHFRKVLDEEGSHIKALEKLAEVEVLLENPAAAIEHIESILASAPSQTHYYCRLLPLYHRTGNSEGVEKAAAAILELPADNPERLKQTVPALLEASLVRQAVDEYKRYISAYPQKADFPLALARLYEQHEKHSLAAVQYQKVLHQKKTPEVFVNLADSYHRMQKFDAEKRMLEEALGIDQKHIEARVRMVALIDRKDDKEAEFKKVRELIGEKDLAGDLKERIVLIEKELGTGPETLPHPEKEQAEEPVSESPREEILFPGDEESAPPSPRPAERRQAGKAGDESALLQEAAEETPVFEIPMLLEIADEIFSDGEAADDTADESDEASGGDDDDSDARRRRRRKKKRRL